MVNALQRRGNDLLTRPMAVLRKVLLDVRRRHAHAAQCPSVIAPLYYFFVLNRLLVRLLCGAEDWDGISGGHSGSSGGMPFAPLGFAPVA
jgi:hypothetical protein